jgi:CheY-like chemotaxis protein/HPt (histidine-containing phosphotransfer) domain-containing protein
MQHETGARKELPTILLIDDDLVSREVMATVLTLSGYTIHTAIDGEAALELLGTGECAPDVILMDAQMPGLSGTRLIAELRARSHALLLAISGSNTPSEVVAAADGFLLKPFGADALQQALDHHRPQAAPAAVSDAELDVPVVSAETLAQLREMMPEKAVRQIYAAVVADLSKRAAALEVAIAAGDVAQIRGIGHAIKGGCGMAGALEAARVGALLEATPLKTKGNHLDNSRALLGNLRTAARNLERMLEAEFQV